MKKSAFTLIELLVVIAIIAILAALALPQLGKAIETAKGVTDSNNLHSLGQVMFKYLTDHDSEMPASGAGTTWPIELHKIIPDYKPFKSPFDKRPDALDAAAPVSYGINKDCLGLSASDFIAPSSLIMMADSATLQAGKPVFSGTAGTDVLISAATNCGVYRGGTFINVLFADWHVVPMNYTTDYTDDASTKGKSRWKPTFDPTAP